MRVVIAGGRGYLGRHLTQHLSAMNHEVAPLTRTSQSGAFRDLVSGREGPLAEHLKDGTAVVNLAGELVHDRSAGIRHYFESNVAFADDLARAAVEANAQVVIHASSRLVYPSDLSDLAQEERDVRPDTPYGLSKQWGEDATRVATRNSRTSAISLRIGQVTGGDHPGLGVINRFINQARSGRPITVHGAGSAVRDIVHVKDVSRAIAAALCYRGAWTAVNIGGTSPVSVAELANEVARIANAGPVQHADVDDEDVSNYGLAPHRSQEILGWGASTTWTEIIAENWARAEEAMK